MDGRDFMRRSRGKWLLVASGWWLGRPVGAVGIGIGESRRPTSSFALLRMTSVRREEIEAAPVVGWPLDSVILNAVKNLGAWQI